MIAAICVDDRGGILFNKRRLSRDRVQIADLLSLCDGRRLWVSPYSASLFPGQAEIVEDPLSQAEMGDVCFLEGQPLEPFLDRLESLVLYRWGRTYPADTYLDVDPETAGLVLTERKEFAGSSHEKILREVYESGRKDG